MQYFDKNGKEIKSGMKLLMDDGSIEMVYNTVDQYGNSDLGINASNEAFLKRHPEWQREYYSLSMFRQSDIEVCPTEQKICDELDFHVPEMAITMTASTHPMCWYSRRILVFPS